MYVNRNKVLNDKRKSVLFTEIIDDFVEQMVTFFQTFKLCPTLNDVNEQNFRCIKGKAKENK